MELALLRRWDRREMRILRNLVSNRCARYIWTFEEGKGGGVIGGYRPVFGPLSWFIARNYVTKPEINHHIKWSSSRIIQISNQKECHTPITSKLGWSLPRKWLFLRNCIIIHVVKAHATSCWCSTHNIYGGKAQLYIPANIWQDAFGCLGF